MMLRFSLQRVLISVAVAVAVVTVPTAAHASGNAVPFTDPYAQGSLTLCDRNHQPITSGEVNTQPFIWSAVSSTPAPSGYTRAYLLVYQPIQYVDPSSWTGYPLNDDAIFSNRAHPIAQSTNADNPLLWPFQSMPPRWDGLYELRMYFTGPNISPLSSPYPAAVIRVSGRTWTLLTEATTPCTVGTAVSVEQFFLPKSELAHPRTPVRPAVTTPAHASNRPTSKVTPKTKATNPFPKVTGSGQPVAAAAASNSSKSGGSPSNGGGSPWLMALIVIGVAALATAAGLFIRHRKRMAT
jgi:hypothetical protein